GGLLRTVSWQHVALTYDKTSGTARIYLDGTVVGQVILGPRALQTSYDLFFGRRVAISGTNYRYTGGMDEICLYDRALTGGEIGAIAAAGPSGKCKLPQPPRIVGQPQNRAVTVGETVSFNVTAAGTGILNYQWYSNAVPIPNASQASLVLTSVQSSQAANYFAIVSNANGSATSRVAVLVVSLAPLCLAAPPGLVGWWPLDGDGNELVNGRVATLVGSPAFSPGIVDRGMVFDGLNDEADVAAQSAIDVGMGAGLTIEMWIKPSSLNSPQPLAEWNNRQGTVGVQFWISLVPPTGSGVGSLFAALMDRNGTAPLLSSAPGILRADIWQHVALTYQRTGGLARLYLNGAVAGQVNIGSRALQTSYELFFGRRVAVSGTNYRYTGGMDEIGLYDHALTASEIQAIVDAGAAGRCKVAQPPRILSPPQSQAAVVGETVSFNVTASGTGPLGYQWRFEEVPISSASQATLVLPGIQSSQAGHYSVVVSNAGGMATSAVAVLVVHLPPPTLRVISVNAAAGGQADVPIELIAQGNENALGFSLNFDAAVLGFVSLTPGRDAPPGAALIVNTNQTASGRLGFGFALSAGQALSSGTQQLAIIHFSVAVLSNATTRSVSFGDSPTVRQVSDQQAINLPSIFADGTISISAVDFEGDVAPRPGGDRSLTIIDWVQLGRYVAALDSITSPDEFQRADCAPRTTLGNGVISVTDYVQAGRYALGLDPLTPVGGPISAGAMAPAGFQPAGGGAVLCLRDTGIPQGQTNVVPISLVAIGQENALSFSIRFDESKVSYAGVGNGAGAANATLTINTSAAEHGRLGVVVALPPGAAIKPGTQEILKLRLAALSTGISSSPISFADQPVPRETSDARAVTIATSYTSGMVNVTPPPGPPLTATRVGTSFFITWPSIATGFELESATALDSPTWTLVPGVVDLGAQKLSINAMTGASKYFRLRKP
ncbi:MAG: peptidyl-prolyl cis-trans isomerase, partial [Verrucomicrobiota bacterium]